MSSLQEVKVENAGCDDCVDWIEFKGSQKEQKLRGRIIEAPEDKDYVVVEYVVSYVAKAIVHKHKITRVTK